MENQFYRTAIFRDNAPLSMETAKTVDGFELSGVEPTGTKRRIAFSYVGTPNINTASGATNYYKLVIDGSGTATMAALATQNITVDSVLNEGNTAEEIASVKSIPEWVGKSIYPVIAMQADEDSASVPTMKLGIKMTSGSDVYEKYESSPVYTLSETTNVDVVSLDANTEAKGKAVITVQVRFMVSGAWGEYMNLTDAKNVKAQALQFRSREQVTTLDGTDSASVIGATVVYCGSDAKVSGSTAEIITQTMHFAEQVGKKGVGFAQAMIKHAKLRDATIKAYAAFRTEPKTREMVAIGTGNGKEQTVKLPDTNINHNSIAVQIDEKGYWGFSYNTETNEVTFTADKGAAVTASYECDWEDETWKEMTQQSCQLYPDSGDYGTKFNYTLPSTETDKTITGVKFELLRPEGDISEASMGTGTGDTQVFLLPHYARKDTIACTGKWTYNDITRVLKVVAEKGTEIKCSYHWVAESHEVHDITAGWAEEA